MEEKRNMDCPCTNTGCPNRTYCERCRAAHANLSEPVACER